MKRKKNQNQKRLKALSNEFLVMSQKEVVGFYEKAVICDIAEYLLASQRYEDALMAARWAFTLYPFSVDVVYLKAQVLYSLEEYADALYYLDKAVSLSPSHTDSHLLTATILVKMERYEQAQEILYNIQPNVLEDETQSNIHLCFASIYENLDEHDKVFQSLCDALRTDLDNNAILEQLSFCTDFCDQHEEHIDFLNEYLDQRSFSSAAWYNIGHSYFQLGQHDLASEAFEYAYLLDTHFYQAYLDRADIFTTTKAYNQALKIYETALEQWNKDDTLWIGKGNCHFYLNDYALAFDAYSQAAAHNIYNAESYYGQGLCHLHFNKPLLALPLLEQAVALDNRKEEFAAALGDAYYILGDVKAAASAFNRAIELAPEMNQYWIRNISFLMDQGDYENAFVCIQDAFANTFGAELKYCHAAYCFRTGNRAEGISVLQEAIYENEDLITFLESLYPAMKQDNEVMSIISMYRL